jgi:GNAT superfamily N-acetyltransferase
MAGVLIRRLCDDDSVRDLTLMLHRAYSQLADMGLQYVATHQDEQVTKSRITSGRCFVAALKESLVGTVVYHPPCYRGHSPWLDREDVAHFGQLAVDPPYQRDGIGQMLVDVVEAEALRDGAKEIALDTAEPALHLIDWYGRLGYRTVERTDWDETNYTSVIMSKTLS